MEPFATWACGFCCARCFQITRHIQGPVQACQVRAGRSNPMLQAGIGHPTGPMPPCEDLQLTEKPKPKSVSLGPMLPGMRGEEESARGEGALALAAACRLVFWPCFPSHACLEGRSYKRERRLESSGICHGPGDAVSGALGSFELRACASCIPPPNHFQHLQLDRSDNPRLFR